ncbi:unnamed protein product [Blepharisma stoltei]|uniref:Integrator complex subunit 3 N-terminal domain-containing protein n=1 Tax=Blepharisma stoltei TaxID=1481888 RepID=A0AAU9IMA2_9CILI|nr:unnamed protein product [Blepharisma stoltei]
MELSLFEKSEIELVDGALEEIEENFIYVRDLIGLKTDESEILAILQTRSIQGEHEIISRGVLYGILTGMDWLSYLLLTSRDNFQTACNTLSMMLPKLKSTQRAVWLFTQLWKTESPAFTGLFMTILRSLDLVNEIKTQLDWINTQQFASLVFYKVLRGASLLAAEGMPVLFDHIHIISQIWIHRRDACISIGRDLVRIVSSLAESGGIEHIWNDLFASGRDGAPLYWSLLCTPTHPKFHSVLLKPEIENKLAFIVENGYQSNYTRYLKWIMETYNDHVLDDLVRFIVNYPVEKENVHRWQIVAWLLTNETDHQIQASIKQALVYDCLFFNSQDQAYIIEPAMSFLKHSITNCPKIAEELLEFMLTSAELYDKRSTPRIMRSLKDCFTVACTQGFFPSLQSLIGDERIDGNIRTRLKELLEATTHDGDLSPPAALFEKEDTSLSAPRSFVDYLGEIAFVFANEPNFDILMEMIHKSQLVNEDLCSFVIKCLTHEFIQPLTLDLPQNSVLYQIFLHSETNARLRELLKLLHAAESSIGVRLLVYSLQKNSKLYQQFEDQLERDLLASLQDISLETLHWVFPEVFAKLSKLVTPNIIHFFLQTTDMKLLHKVEQDLMLDSYSILSNKLSQVLEKSDEFSSSEKIYLWKLIQAEIKPDQIGKLLDHFQHSLPLGNQWESLSGLVCYLCSHTSQINIENVKQILTLPAKYCKITVSVVLVGIKVEFIEEAVLEIIKKAQFQGQINILKHLKHWIEQDGKLASIVKTKSLQEVLISTMQALSSDYFREFSCLLETSRQLYSS